MVGGVSMSALRPSSNDSPHTPFNLGDHEIYQWMKQYIPARLSCHRFISVSFPVDFSRSAVQSLPTTDQTDHEITVVLDSKFTAPSYEPIGRES